MRERHPLNAPGDFYVERGRCTNCGAPEAEAPMLMAHDDDDGCYFRRQPETDEEVQCAINAISVSCMEPQRYAGMDESIRVRLKVLGYGRSCDHPIDPADEPRTRVRFSLQADDAVALVRAFAGKLHESVTVHVYGDARQATMEWNSAYRSGWVYRVERLEDRNGLPTWLLHKERDYLGCQTVLEGLGASDLMWFSEDAWENDKPGYLKPSSCCDEHD